MPQSLFAGFGEQVTRVDDPVAVGIGCSGQNFSQHYRCSNDDVTWRTTL
jgi:hypothetical protein